MSFTSSSSTTSSLREQFSNLLPYSTTKRDQGISEGYIGIIFTECESINIRPVIEVSQEVTKESMESETLSING